MIDLDHARQQLMELRDELAARRDRIAEHKHTPLEQDFAEQATQQENAEVVDALGDATTVELRAVNHALQRIEAGTYPNCERCGQRIAEERLKALPYTAACIACAG